MVYLQIGLENRLLAPLPNPAFSYGATFSCVVSYEGSRHSVCSTDDWWTSKTHRIKCHAKPEWQVATETETEVKFTSKSSLSTSYLRLAFIFLSFLLVWVSGSLLQINQKYTSKTNFLPVVGNMYFRNLFLYQFISVRMKVSKKQSRLFIY